MDSGRSRLEANVEAKYMHAALVWYSHVDTGRWLSQSMCDDVFFFHLYAGEAIEISLTLAVSHDEPDSVASACCLSLLHACCVVQLDQAVFTADGPQASFSGHCFHRCCVRRKQPCHDPLLACGIGMYKGTTFWKECNIDSLAMGILAAEWRISLAVITTCHPVLFEIHQQSS